MKYLTSIIKKFITNDLPKPVGRWRIETCNKQMNYKIDLSNEDHCGLVDNMYWKKTKIKK